MQSRQTNHPRIAVLPPLIIGFPFVAGMGLQWSLPLRFLPRWVGLTLGVLCILPTIVLLTTAHSAFRQARTSMLYTRRSWALIVNGPFGFTRNPLFVGLVLFYAGVCLATGMPWPLLFLPVVIALLHWVVIVPEEHYLEDQFGDVYRAYRAHVRRWL